LLILFGWIRLISNPSNQKAVILSIFSTIISMCLVAFVRPYYIKILFVAAILVGIVLLIYYLVRPSKSKQNWKVLAYLLVSVFILGWGVKYIHADNRTLDGIVYDDPFTAVFQICGDRKNIVSCQWQWQKTAWLPESVEKYVASVATVRARLINYNIIVESGSSIDTNVSPRNVLEVVTYMPRALQIGLFGPFPYKWFERLSAIRIVAVFEMVVWYVALCGMFLALYYLRSAGLFIAIAFSLFIIGVLSFSSPNMGTLYRFRYAYLFVLLLIGVLGWTHFLLYWKRDLRNKTAIIPDKAPESIDKNLSCAELTKPPIVYFEPA